MTTSFKTYCSMGTQQFMLQETVGTGCTFRVLQPPLHSRALYKNATRTSTTAYEPQPPTRATVQPYMNEQNIDFAMMAAAARRHIWYMRQHLWQPTTNTLHTDSSVVSHTLIKGTGWTL